jgi:hypothetical protein
MRSVVLVALLRSVLRMYAFSCVCSVVLCLWRRVERPAFVMRVAEEILPAAWSVAYRLPYRVFAIA